MIAFLIKKTQEAVHIFFIKHSYLSYSKNFLNKND